MYKNKMFCADAIRVFACLSIFVACFTCAGLAQLTRSALTGTVTDPAGRVLPGVEVVAVQDGTGLRRATETTASGTFEIAQLPVGVYTVTVHHAGFRDTQFNHVVQKLGLTRTLDVTLLIAGSDQQVQVNASTQPLDQTSNTLGTVVEHKEVRELSSNGRTWATLTAFGPGAMDTGGSNQRSVRFAGRGRDDNNFSYDGVDATNIINQAQQPYVRLAIPLDTIQEFRVNSMLTTAETGATAGGQLVVTSASGTNQLHGGAFEFLRNNVFDAREPIDILNPHQPPFHLNQFGGSIGGPVIRERTFFFTAYEGYRQVLGQTLPGYVPSASFRARTIAHSPVLANIVNAYPVGQIHINSNIDQFVGEGTQALREDSGMFRLDQIFSDKTTAFVRVNIDAASNNVPLGSSGQYLDGLTESSSSPVNVAVELLHVFSPELVNQTTFGFNRSTAIARNVNQTGLFYVISVPGLTQLNNNRLSTGVGNSFSYIDNVTWVHGRHVIKGGVEFRRIQMNQGSSENGTISFSSLDNFAANLVNTANLTDALPVNGLRKWQYYGYVQDEFKWRPNFTWNLGLRYSFFNFFHEVHGWPNPFDFATCGPQGFCGVGASFGQPDHNDFDPRIAFAWAPAVFHGSTVIRSGFGIYHEDGQLDDQNLPNSNEVLRYSLAQKTTPGLRYPIDPFLVNESGTVSPRAQDRNRKDTYVTQWGLSIQQALPAEFVGTISYVGSKGTHLLTLSEVNLVDPLTGVRPYPQFGQIDWRGTRNNSSYEGLSLAAKRTFDRGLLISASYMWSHEIDDGSNGSGDGDSLTAQNVACQPCEKASGAFDARHAVHASAVYELPLGTGKPYMNEPGLLRALLGSWLVSSIVAARTGFPVNVTVDRNSTDTPDGNTNNQRPDLVPGVSLTPPGGQSTRLWINPAAFAVPANGTWGNAPRNLLRGPGVWQIDIGLSKQIVVTERVHLQFRAETFNVFNHPQYGAPQADLSAGSSFGKIISTVNTGPVGTGTPRQMQFALRVAF